MTPEEELRAELQQGYPGLPITIEPSSSEYFEMLQRRFPVCGSKIDWDRVPNSTIRRVNTVDSEHYFDEAIAFVREMLESEGLDRESQAVVIGDSAIEGAFRMPLYTLVLCLRTILRMPQHTYVLAPNGAWCLVLTMEGDVCFGYAPS